MKDNLNMTKVVVLLASAILVLSFGCHNCSDPFKMPDRLTDPALGDDFGLITNGMSEHTVLKTLGRPCDAGGGSMWWIVYGRSIVVTFRDSVVTNVERRSWVEPPPHERSQNDP